MNKTLYSLGRWTIVKEHNLYVVYNGRIKRDESTDFAEAYSLLQQHKKSA